MSGKKKSVECSLSPFLREDCLSIQEVQQNTGWGITTFDLQKVWEFTKGEGVVIAVLDTGCELTHPDLIQNLIPGYNCINPESPPDDDNGHGCVSPCCMVHTNLGGIQKIESLYESIDSEELICEKPEGRYFVKKTDGLKTYSLSVDKQISVIGDIESIQKLPIDGDVVHVELEGGITYLLTPWHPVYLIKNRHHKVYDIFRKRADEISPGDQFIFGRGENCGQLGSKQFIELPIKMVCKNCKHEPKFWKGNEPSKCKNCLQKSWNQVIESVEIDTDLAYLTGIILTDGHIGKDRFEVSSNTPEILQRVGQIAESRGWNYTIEENRILVYGKSAVNHVLSLGLLKDKKTLNQTLPNWVGKSDSKTQSAFIAGVIDGDGCISKSNTKNRITTASYSFACEMACLFNSCGISSCVSEPEYDHRKRSIQSKHPVYKIVHAKLSNDIIDFLIHPNKILRSKINPRSVRVGRRVKSVSIKKYQGYFYDFTVKDYNNYIADGHFVSNTHVTGILIAENNEIGMVGVCPKAKVMPIKTLDKEGIGNMLNVAKGIRWAADNGADFISMSLGAPVPVAEVRKAIQYALNKGIITFVAVGNAGNTKEVFYPAAYPETIAIGAITKDLQRADFSNTGNNIDFMAPGVDIYSTVPENWYAKMSGTSMAQPFACGIAVLVKSFVKKARPDIELKTAIDYRKLLMEHTIPVNGDTSKFYQGFGIIDPRKFYSSIKTPL